MERAQAFIVGARPAQLDEIADDLDYICGVEYAVDCFLIYPAHNCSAKLRLLTQILGIFVDFM